MACKFELLFNQKFKVMKNLMQKLVKATLCLGVVSVSLIACSEDVQEDTNIITLDQLNDELNKIDSTINDTNVVVEDSLEFESVDADVEEVVEKEED